MSKYRNSKNNQSITIINKNTQVSSSMPTSDESQIQLLQQQQKKKKKFNLKNFMFCCKDQEEENASEVQSQRQSSNKQVQQLVTDKEKQQSMTNYSSGGHYSAQVFTPPLQLEQNQQIISKRSSFYQDPESFNFSDYENYNQNILLKQKCKRNTFLLQFHNVHLKNCEKGQERYQFYDLLAQRYANEFNYVHTANLDSDILRAFDKHSFALLYCMENITIEQQQTLLLEKSGIRSPLNQPVDNLINQHYQQMIAQQNINVVTQTSSNVSSQLSLNSPQIFNSENFIQCDYPNSEVMQSWIAKPHKCRKLIDNVIIIPQEHTYQTMFNSQFESMKKEFKFYLQNLLQDALLFSEKLVLVLSPQMKIKEFCEIISEIYESNERYKQRSLKQIHISMEIEGFYYNQKLMYLLVNMGKHKKMITQEKELLEYWIPSIFRVPDSAKNLLKVNLNMLKNIVFEAKYGCVMDYLSDLEINISKYTNKNKKKLSQKALFQIIVTLLLSNKVVEIENQHKIKLFFNQVLRTYQEQIKQKQNSNSGSPQGQISQQGSTSDFSSQNKLFNRSMSGQETILQQSQQFQQKNQMQQLYISQDLLLINNGVQNCNNSNNNNQHNNFSKSQTLNESNSSPNNAKQQDPLSLDEFNNIMDRNNSHQDSYRFGSISVLSDSLDSENNESNENKEGDGNCKQCRNKAQKKLEENKHQEDQPINDEDFQLEIQNENEWQRYSLCSIGKEQKLYRISINGTHTKSSSYDDLKSYKKNLLQNYDITKSVAEDFSPNSSKIQNQGIKSLLSKSVQKQKWLNL